MAVLLFIQYAWGWMKFQIGFYRGVRENAKEELLERSSSLDSLQELSKRYSLSMLFEGFWSS
jgi:hypothetical protein